MPLEVLQRFVWGREHAGRCFRATSASGILRDGDLELVVPSRTARRVCVSARESVVAVAAVENRTRIEACRAPDIIRGKSALV